MLKLYDLGLKMKKLNFGDRWEYDVTGEMTSEAGVIQIVGQNRVSVESRETERGVRNAIVFEQQRRIAGMSGPEAVLPAPLGIFFFLQDDITGDVLIEGDNMTINGAARFAKIPQVFYPGLWSLDTSYNNILDFGAAGKVENSLRVESIVELESPLGKFKAWKAPITSSSDQFGEVVGCDYWTPQLGAPIKFEMTVSGPGGMTIFTQAHMRFTNVI